MIHDGRGSKNSSLPGLVKKVRLIRCRYSYLNNAVLEAFSLDYLSSHFDSIFTGSDEINNELLCDGFIAVASQFYCISSGSLSRFSTR